MNKLIALWMGERDGDKPWNLNYDSPDHFARFTRRLFENKEMWDKYYQYAFKRYLNSETHNTFVPWLFSDRTLFTSLFAEFLRLDETVEEFGREEICSEFNRWHNPCPPFCDKCDDGSGKVLSAWAREVNNA